MAIQAGRDPNTSHSATKPHRMRIEIVQMGKHFLYLPLYYAELRNFFGYISEKYEINIITARPATDVQAYRMLMRGDPDNNRLPAHFAILDPTQMLNPDFVIPAGEAPALLGGIVTNAAFWAVDSGTRRLVRISDLAQFSQIIAFNRGTTSFAIAHRIYTDAGKTPSILTVESGQELRALEHQKVDTIALSPDILEADIVEAESKRYQIDMILGTTPEYNNVLVTGLLSRRSVVNQHRDLSVGLLKAINHAAALVRNGDDGVVEFAYRYFRVQSTERVRSALARANDAYVFPFNIEVVDGQWVNAARAYYHSMLPDGAGKEAAREMHEQRARDALEQWIVPYRHLARKAITEVMKPLSEPSDAEIRQERPFLRRILEVVRYPLYIIAFLGVAMAGRFLSGRELMVLGVCALLAYLLGELKPLQLRFVPLANWIHWLLWLAVAIIGIIGVRSFDQLILWELDKWMTYIGVPIGIIAADLIFIATIYLSKRGI